MNKQSLRYFPIILFASVMGFAAVTIAIINLEDIYRLNPVASSVFITLTTLLFILNGGILIYRLFRYLENVKQDFNHPVKVNFFATISISLLLLAVLFVNIQYHVSFVFWLMGMILQLLLTLTILTKMFWQAPFDLKLFTPATFIPIVGNLVVPIGGFAYVSEQINWFFLAVGLFFSIVYMVFVFYRLFFVAPLPPPMVPSIFIALAPPSVGFVAYTTAVETVDVFAQILYGLALFLGLYLIIQFVRMIQGPFFITMWAFLFPTGAFTIATVQMYDETNYLLYQLLSIFQMIFLIALIIYLSYYSIKAWLKGKLAVADS
ncbi:MAG TPA: SLAC1 anion channel family protein [Bacillota bacterium]|nr:SLAC1 anion channel family protein [Bacillota bacterium]